MVKSTEVMMPAAKTTPKKATKTSAKKSAKKITADEVWAGFDRIEKILAEIAKAHQDLVRAQQETERVQQETKKTLSEAQQETERVQQETKKTLNEAIGGLSNKLGSLVEHIMTPDLPRKFKEFGFAFDRITTVKWAVDGSLYAQIDGLLENGAEAMVVEVKTTLRRKDVDEHLDRMEKIRAYADGHNDKREFLGAVASTIIDRDTRAYALSKGLFVIEPSGEDVKITKPDSEKTW
jgi:hypothetical protein